MKSVIVKLQIQFDIFEDDKEKELVAARTELDNINIALSKTGLDSSPVLLCNAVDDDNIEIAPEEEN